MKRILLIVGALACCCALLFSPLGAQAQRSATVYFQSGGDRLVVSSGGSADVESGGEIDIESGGALKMAGTAITSTAAELNILDTVTATAAELNTLDLSAVGAIVKVKTLSIAADFDNTEQDTGWNLPAKAIVLNAYVDVTTADASQTIDVGTAVGESGDPNGWLAAASVNGTGLVKGVLTAGGVTKGALLLETVTDSNTDTLNAATEDIVSGGKSVVYTGSDTTNTMRGSIYIVYIEVS